MKTKKVKHIFVEENEVLVNCYRIKIEETPTGIRIYSFNSRKNGGDAEIIIDGEITRITISDEQRDFNKRKVLPFISINPSKRRN